MKYESNMMFHYIEEVPAINDALKLLRFPT